MFVRNFHLDRFLGSIYGTEPFVEYCGQRNIAFEHPAPGPLMHEEDYRRWLSALAQLTSEQQIQVELDLAKVNEMGDRDAVAQLITAAEGKDLPSDLIPGDSAVALWFFLHHPGLFHEVFLNHEAQELAYWRNAQAPPGLLLNYLEGKAAALAASLQEFFKSREGIGRFCAADAYRLNEAYCFVAHVSDRTRLLEGFTDQGEHTLQRFWPALPVLFAYYPQDGMVLLKSHLQASDWVLELFRLFGRVVLGVELEAGCFGHTFELDLLKRRFDPLPDAEDMEMVRVKTLYLHYPERHGRRQVKLETLSSDEQFAILQLVQAHLSGAGLFDQLRVSHAELQVKLRVEGRSKSYLIRLWPNRCNLNQSALGERFRACLKSWGLYHAR
jgi:hypothetical protein